MEQIEEAYEGFKIMKQGLDVLYSQYLKNSDKTLEEKWNILTTIGRELEKTDGTYFNPKGIDWNRHTLYDDFYIDRNQRYDVEYLLEKSEEDGFLEDKVAFKQDCVNQGNYYYLNDW